MAKRRSNGEGSIFKDKKNNRWIGQYIVGIKDDGKAIRKSVYGKTQKEVITKLNYIKYKLNNDKYIMKNGIKLIKIIEDIREDKFNSNIISEGQYSRPKWTIDKIRLSNIGNLRVQEITRDDIQKFLNSITYLSNSYIKKIHELLVQGYKLAVLKGYVERNIMNDVIKPKSRKENKQVRALTLDEQKIFSNYLFDSNLENERYKNIFLIQIYMGLRIGEVLALSKNDIDLSNGLVYVRRTLVNDIDFKIKMGTKTKTYSGKRDLPIPSFLVDVFIEQIKESKYNKDKLLFLVNDEYIRTSSVNLCLKRILKNLGIDSNGISSHCLRHTYGTRCIEAGMTAVVLQRLMGHKDVRVTLNTYTSVFNRFKQDEIDKVNNYLFDNNLR